MAARKIRKKPANSAASKHVIGALRAAIGRARAGRFGAKDFAAGVDAFRIDLTTKEIRRAVPILAAHPSYRAYVWPSPFPRTWSEYARVGYRTYLDPQEEFEWVASCLKLHTVEINEFLIKKKDFDKALLSGDHLVGEQIVDSIEAKWGVSLWSTEAKISILQRTAGFKAQKDFVSPIISKGTAPSIIRTIIAWISLKFEENTTYAQLHRILDRDVTSRTAITLLLRVIIGDFAPINLEDAGQIISHIDTFCVIDRYLIFTKICQTLAASSSEDEASRLAIRSAVENLAIAVSDAALRRTAFAIGASLPLSRSVPALIEALDAYTIGDYERAETVAASAAVNHPEDISLIGVYLRSVANDPARTSAVPYREGSLVQEIAQALAETLAFGPGGIEAHQKLQKIGLVYSSCGWSAAVQMLYERSPLLSDQEDSCRKMWLAMSAQSENPIISTYLAPLQPPEKYLEATGGGQPFGPTSSLLAAAYGNSSNPAETIRDLGLPVERSKRYQAIALSYRGAVEAAVPLLTEVFSSASTRRARYEAGLALADALLSTGQLGECADVAASLFLNARFVAILLPLRKLVLKLVEAQEAGAPNGARGSLSVAIVTDIYARFVGADQESARSDAYKDFLRSCGVRKASELAKRTKEFDQDALIYFLRYVCVPEVTDQSLALPSTKAVEDERVAVLLLLSELTSEQDRETQLSFLEELREIRTRQVVRETNSRLDQSKIFVNVKGIKKALDVAMRDNWNRYRLLSMQDSEEFIDEIQKLFGKELGTKIITLPLTLPETERTNLFKQMILDVRNLFVESKEFGLDANLSANVRHGYILREIRSPILSQNLITNRPSEGAPHEDNSYWPERLPSLMLGQQDALQKVLNKFSVDIDNRIEELNQKFLRIKSSSHPDGMFAFPVSNATISYLQQRASGFESHDDFFDLILKHFWAITDQNLILIRKFLEGDVIHGFSEAFDQLEMDLERVAAPYALIPIRSAINLARPEVQAAVGRVSNWFTLSNEIEFPDYDAQTAYQAGLETIKSYAVHNVVASNLEYPHEIIMRGWTLPFLGRIIFIILDNIVEHAKIPSGKLEISAQILRKDSYLVVTVLNKLGPAADLDAVEARVQSVNLEYGTEKATQFISVERRSGYPKIWKILTHDLSVDHLLEVTLDRAERTFKVEIWLSASGIVK